MAYEKERVISLEPFYEQPAIVRRLTAGEKRELDNEIARINGLKMRGDEVCSDVRPGDTELICARYYYKEGPFPATADSLAMQDHEVVAIIAARGKELNSPLLLKPKKENNSSNGSEPASGGGHATVQ